MLKKYNLGFATVASSAVSFMIPRNFGQRAVGAGTFLFVLRQRWFRLQRGGHAEGQTDLCVWVTRKLWWGQTDMCVGDTGKLWWGQTWGWCC